MSDYDEQHRMINNHLDAATTDILYLLNNKHSAHDWLEASTNRALNRVLEAHRKARDELRKMQERCNACAVYGQID